MGFTEFCVKAGGSNLNAGTLTGNSTEPGTSAAFTYAGGTFVRSTRVFTVASEDPEADGVAVGQFASIYTTSGATVATYIGRVSAVDSTTITIDATAIAGAASSVSESAGAATCKIGGAWAGPNAAVGFPFNFITAALTNANVDRPRVNFKNAAPFAITAAMTHTLAGPVVFEGYTSTYGDGGRATISGSGASSFVPLTISTATLIRLQNLIFDGNGGTGSSNGVVISSNLNSAHGCVFANMAGTGLVYSGLRGTVVECEAYGCNTNDNPSKSGFDITVGDSLIRCIAHDNAGTNTAGFRFAGGILVDCIADTNGKDGFFDVGDAAHSVLIGCDAYANVGNGILVGASSTGSIYIENCNLIDNGAYGINLVSAGTFIAILRNNGFGSGTMANTSGATNITSGTDIAVVTGSVTYPADKTPWRAPATGDFTVVLPAAMTAGRGTYTQTASGYGGTESSPPIGASSQLSVSGGGRIGIGL